MQLSSLPLLIAASFGFIWFLVSRPHRRGVLNSAQRNQLALLIGMLLFWHLAGALAVVLPIAGLMHLFMAEPLFAELFMFPMVMAPALVVPTLVMLNMLVAWRLFERVRVASKHRLEPDI